MSHCSCRDHLHILHLMAAGDMDLDLNTAEAVEGALGEAVSVGEAISVVEAGRCAHHGGNEHRCLVLADGVGHLLEVRNSGSRWERLNSLLPICGIYRYLPYHTDYTPPFTPSYRALHTRHRVGARGETSRRGRHDD